MRKHNPTRKLDRATRTALERAGYDWLDAKAVMYNYRVRGARFNKKRIAPPFVVQRRKPVLSPPVWAEVARADTLKEATSTIVALSALESY